MSDLGDYLFEDDTVLLQTLAGRPFLYEGDHDLTMHFDFSATQSHMCKIDPDKLMLGYTRTMMGFLLFQPKPERMVMIGLGGGSLAKYCLRHLPDTHFTAVEISSSVIAWRGKFGIPADDHRFKVICADGADYVRNPTELVDVLFVDGFDRDGQPRQLCNAQFYDHCYAKLQEGGILVVNLTCGDIKIETYIARIRHSFAGQVVVVEAEESVNKIAFAFKGRRFPPAPGALSGHALNILADLQFQPLEALAKAGVKSIERLCRPYLQRIALGSVA